MTLVIIAYNFGQKLLKTHEYSERFLQLPAGRF